MARLLQPMPTRRTRKRGAVLILALGAVAVLTVLAVEMTHRSHLDKMGADRSQKASAFRRAFDSGIAVAKGLIVEGRESQGYDFKGDSWNRTLQIECGGGVRVTVRVEDECGKFNVQSLVADPRTSGVGRKTLTRIFEFLGRQDPKRKEAFEKAEQAILRRLDSPDSNRSDKAKHQPLYTLDGLREAGLSSALIFGTPDSDTPNRSAALCDVLTVWGDRRINLNTAPQAVLYGLDSEFDQAQIERIAAWRGEAGGSETTASIEYRPFKQTRDLELVEGIVQRVRVEDQWKVVKNLHAKVADRLTVQSTVFSARLTAEVNGRRRQAWAVFQVGKSGVSAEQRHKSIKLLAYEEIEP
ncbi:MAG: type II secretion system protein GspK [Nitrospira sp.]|nr:type II secretion system protein GspK [Nitrospira sp.]